MLKLDLGGSVQNNCDSSEYLTVDINPNSNLCLNLDDPNFRFPFGDNTVDEIRAFHILEHVNNIFPLLDECHRVLKPDCIMYVVVPKFPEGCATVDPTHVRFVVPENFHYFSRKFAYMGYTNRFWYMNLDEAIRFNSSMRDVCFRLEMSPDKREEQEVNDARQVIKHYVQEEMSMDVIPSKDVLKAVTILSAHGNKIPLIRYKENGEEEGIFAGKNLDYINLGLTEEEIKIAVDRYGVSSSLIDSAISQIEEIAGDNYHVESIDTDMGNSSISVSDATEEFSAVTEPETSMSQEEEVYQAKEHFTGCVICGSVENRLIKVCDMQDESKREAIINIYPDILEDMVCDSCEKLF